MNKTYLGLDLGGTYAKYGCIDAKGRILERGRFSVLAREGPEHTIKRIINHLEPLLAKRPPKERPRGLAVGAAGLIRQTEGVVIYAPNLPGWKDIPLGRRLAEALDIEVRMENDADMFILGEWLFGSGHGLNTLMGVTLGTGLGGGLILNGSLWRGVFGSAAEIGHMVIEVDGPKCKCGSQGCLETFASATAITESARKWIGRGRSCGYQGTPENLTCADLFELAGQGDMVAIEAFEQSGWALGVALNNVVNLIGLEGFIIGGGAAPAFEWIFPRLFSEFAERTLEEDPKRIRIVPAALGRDAPLFGALAVFNEREPIRKE